MVLSLVVWIERAWTPAVVGRWGVVKLSFRIIGIEWRGWKGVVWDDCLIASGRASGLSVMMLLRDWSWWLIESRQLVIRAGPREGSLLRAWWNLDIVISFILTTSSSSASVLLVLG